MRRWKIGVILLPANEVNLQLENSPWKGRTKDGTKLAKIKIGKAYRS